MNLPLTSIAFMSTCSFQAPISVPCNLSFSKSTHPDVVLSEGNATAFDSYNIMSPFVSFFRNKWHLYYAGGPASGMPGYTRYQIGMATSDQLDGPWEKIGRPLFDLGVADDFHTTPTLLRGANNQVLTEGGRYHMLFCGNRNDSVYHATSADGLEWAKEPTPVWKGYAPNVLRIDGELWLYSIYKPADKSPWRIVLARGADWHSLELVQTVLVHSQAWELGTLFYPYVLFEDWSSSGGSVGGSVGSSVESSVGSSGGGSSERNLAYIRTPREAGGGGRGRGRGGRWTMSWSAYANKSMVPHAAGGQFQVTAIGLAHSADGLAWDKCLSNPVLSPTAASPFDSVYVGCPCLVTTGRNGSRLDRPRLFYAGRKDSKHKYFAIGHATAD